MNEDFNLFVTNKANVEVLFNTMNDGFMLTNQRFELVAVNPAFENITGYMLSEIKGSNPRILQSGLTPISTYRQMWSTIHKEGSWTGELLNKRKNGELFWSYLTVTKTKMNRNDESGYYYIAVMRDITERKKYERKIHQLAYYNELTHLPNRKYMEEKLAELLEVSSEKEERKRFAVMFLNIDRFKKVNESYGHQAGDQLIIDAALRMKEATLVIVGCSLTLAEINFAFCFQM